jgi:hypothetical protein
MSTEVTATTVQTPRSAWPMFVAGLLMLGLFWGVNQFMRSSPAPSGSLEEEARAEVRRKNLAELRAANEELLTTYAWVDKAKGVVRIPIARAMELEVAALNEKKPAPAYPIATPASAAAPAPAATTTPQAGPGPTVPAATVAPGPTVPAATTAPGPTVPATAN